MGLGHTLGEVPTEGLQGETRRSRQCLGKEGVGGQGCPLLTSSLDPDRSRGVTGTGVERPLWDGVECRGKVGGSTQQRT